MKICYAHDGISPYDHLFLKYLLEREHEVHLITFCPSNRLRQVEVGFPIPSFEGLNIHHFDVQRVLGTDYGKGLWRSSKIMIMLRDLFQLCALSILVKKIKPDVLNGCFLTTYGLWSALSLYHPFLLTIWGSDILVLPRQLKAGELVARFVLKIADAVIVDSMVQRDATIKYGCEPTKIVSFPWAVDLSKFNPAVSGDKIRRPLGWEENLIVLCTRWHMPVYGVNYLLRAIPEILKKNHQVRFIIAGCGPLTNQFKDFVTKAKLRKYVRFAGKILHKEMPEYMAACDIYISPSLSDGTSASLLEAMACSKPVVVSSIPGNLEWVTNNVNGFTVPTRDVKALAKAVSELLRDDGLRKKFGARNFETVKKRADLRRSLQTYEDTLVMLATKRR